MDAALSKKLAFTENASENENNKSEVDVTLFKKPAFTKYLFVNASEYENNNSEMHGIEKRSYRILNTQDLIKTLEIALNNDTQAGPYEIIASKTKLAIKTPRLEENLLKDTKR